MKPWRQLAAGAALAFVAGVGACARSAPPPRVAPQTPPGPVCPELQAGELTALAIDQCLGAQWARQRITPSPPADEATFLRRAYLDMVGTVPPPAEVRAFLVDAAPDKRLTLLRRLSEDPRFAVHWADQWTANLLGRGRLDGNVDATALKAWLRQRFAENTPWNKTAFDLLSASGTNVESGAVNWLLRYDDSPTDAAGAAARVLLGVQLQCAQCHDHKTERWTRDDFEAFAAPFARLQVVPRADLPRAGAGARKVVELRDLPRPAPRFAKNPDLASLVAAKPRAFDGTPLAGAENPRFALAAWAVSRANGTFAKAFVNRVWAHFLGRGFVDPVDDLRPTNPPSAPELFDALAADFVAHDYDVKRLILLVAGSRAYGLAASPSPADDGNRTWSHFRLSPLGPDELLRSLMDVTNAEEALQRRGTGGFAELREGLHRQYNFLFDVDETVDRVDFEGSVAQALILLNGKALESGVRAHTGSVLSDILAIPGSEADRVEALFLRALARKPSEAELGTFLRGLAGKAPKARVEAYEDLFWALLNSSEFLFNH